MFGLTSKGSSKEQPAPPVETLAIEDAPAVIVDAEKGSKNCGVEELIYLDGKEALDRAVTMLESAGRVPRSTSGRTALISRTLSRLCKRRWCVDQRSG